MFTAIIAQKEYIDKVNAYSLFLKPFMDPKHVAFCEWNPDGSTLAEMVPELPDAIGRRTEWRALIICDESGLELKNPFDLVSLQPEKFEGNIIGELDEGNAEQYEAYCVSEHEKKMKSYDEASNFSLTRLVTYFCEGPNASMPESELEGDTGYQRYIAEYRKKEELRSAIRKDEVIYTSLPSEVVCVAKRTLFGKKEDLENAWMTHNETEYSRFYDRNMYFDKMRYLVFDILPKTQRNYPFDYVRFLYATMLLAANEIPAGSLSPNRIYKFDCEHDEEALKELLFTYEAKLDLTKDMLEQRIVAIKSKRPERLSDREAEKIFCGSVTVPVTFSDDTDTKELYISHKDIGLANGCPSEEDGVWDSRYNKSKKALHRTLKQARRSLKRAATDCRAEDSGDLTRVGLLNEFQIEDVKEHIANEELGMLSVPIPDLYNEEAYIERLDEDSERVKEKIRKRMHRGTTLTVGGLALFAYVVGFFTLFWQNSSSNLFNMTTSAIIALSALGVFGLVAIVTLFFLRHSLVKRFKTYNRTAEAINNEIYGAMSDYSQYLGHVSNVRRGFRVLDTAENREDPDRAKIILYRKHIIDIETAKAESRDIFGHYMVEKMDIDTSCMLEYDYNYEKPVEYEYPIPYTEGRVKQIEFMRSGNRVNVPVNFVKNITVRREEIYD